MTIDIPLKDKNGRDIEFGDKIRIRNVTFVLSRDEPVLLLSDLYGVAQAIQDPNNGDVEVMDK